MQDQNDDMQQPMRIAALILAAGASTRFGSAKQLARIGDRTMLEAVIGIARDAGLAPIIAVVPPDLVVPADVVPVVNPFPALGMSRSLQLGIRAVPSDADGAVILLGDQPTVSPGLVADLVRARGQRPIVATKAGGLMAPPAFLERSAFAMADVATGDRGLRDLMRDNAGVVTAVEVGEHPPDIDMPADLAALGEPCPGCGARFQPLVGGTTHAYIGSTPACWSAFGELIAREFRDPTYGWIHRHTVDVYAVQHPGVEGRRQRQSVAVHLIGLCQWLEYGMTANDLNPMTQHLASEKRDWPWLDPPRSYALTVLDVLRGTDAESHGRLVRAWAESTWKAWSAHQSRVRQWAADARGAVLRRP